MALNESPFAKEGRGSIDSEHAALIWDIGMMYKNRGRVFSICSI